MEIILALSFIAFLIWLLSKGRRTSARPQSGGAGQARPRAATPTGASDGTVVKGTRSVSADDCWVAPGREVTVAGYTISAGMLYVGQGLASISGLRVEPALIDPSLPVKRSSPDRTGAGMTYWPSYSSIAPECRAAYLDWLSTGRQAASAYIGYVFLYFYGLERRVLAEALQSEQAKARVDLPAIKSEVERLLSIYSDNGSFRRYAMQLLDVLEMIAAGDGEIKAPMERTSHDLPASLRVAIGRIVADGKPLPADWALSWFWTHPDTSLRAAVRRCAEEFGELFRTRYVREFGDGLRIKANPSKLQINFTPASASFGGPGRLQLDVPDVGAVTAPLSKLRQLGENCAADLDAFSRWVGRNPDAPKTIAAVALLPHELATTHGSQEASGLWAWIAKTIDQQDTAVCKTDDLLQHCASFGVGKLAKSEAVLLAQLLEKGGYGIEPDVRFGGAPLTPGGTIVVFKLPPGASQIASPQYAAATVLLHLAVAVSAADGSISPSEEQHLKEHLERALALGDAERLRLAAHLNWLMTSPPGLAGLKRRLDPLDQRQRTAIADFIIGVAGADGQISPDEIRTLGKVYPMLGLDADAVYSHVHAMSAGSASVIESTDPLPVVPATPSTGYAIPSRTAPAQAIRLDMTAVKAKLAESAQISAILDDIFTEDEVASAPLPTAARASTGKMPPAYGALLARLAERPEWSREEFETIASECRLLPDGAIDTLNETAFEHTGGPVLEGDDPIQIDPATAKELLK
jgi:uncharacterized tellurite resistance protein B-like protein